MIYVLVGKKKYYVFMPLATYNLTSLRRDKKIMKYVTRELQPLQCMYGMWRHYACTNERIRNKLSERVSHLYAPS